MVCETELRLKKVFADAIVELDQADSRMSNATIPFEERALEQSAAHLKMVNARLTFVNHRASCSICALNHRKSEGLGK
jgi:hypothetical protein